MLIQDSFLRIKSNFCNIDSIKKSFTNTTQLKSLAFENFWALNRKDDYSTER